MSRTGAEAKPPWSAVPRAVKDEVERVAGARITRATRAYGGYAPSATYRLTLANGRTAFLKSTYQIGRASCRERVYSSV